MNIILPIHIAIALTSVFYTVYVLFNPSKKGLNASYALVAATIISGTYLVATHPVHMTQTCGEGLVYAGLMITGIFVIKHKLAAQKI